jgi:hypothetical protein
VSMSRRSAGIIARLRQMPRGAAGDEPASPSSSGSESEPLPQQVAELRARVAHLENLIQGLQDSVHRGSERQDKRLTDVEKRLDPAMLAAALSQDARERGL